MILCLDALVLLPALVQAGREHEAVEVGAAHTVLVQWTQLNRVQIQVGTVAVPVKRQIPT